jgi:predicted RNA-binding protein with RPS1 domain
VAQAGDVVTGVVTEVQPGKAMVKVGGWQYVLHKPQFSGPCVESLEDVLNADEQVTAMVLRQRPDSKHVTLSTKLLERNPGDMLTNRQAVYAGAKEVAACWRKRQAMTAEIKQAAEEGRAPCVDMQVGHEAGGQLGVQGGTCMLPTKLFVAFKLCTCCDYTYYPVVLSQLHAVCLIAHQASPQDRCNTWQLVCGT